jgi:hypothetical protein
MMEMEVIDKGKIINQAQLLWGPALPITSRPRQAKAQLVVQLLQGLCG